MLKERQAKKKKTTTISGRSMMHMISGNLIFGGLRELILILLKNSER